MSALKRFGGFKPEAEKPVVEAKVAAPTKMKAIIGAWYADEYFDDCNADYAYDCAEKALNGLRATAAEINEFIAFLKGLPENDRDPRNKDHVFRERAGTFLSALINTSPDSDFDIWLSGLAPPDDFAYDNCKNVTVHGDVGDNAGNGNTGRLEIIGDSDSMLAYRQQGGEIILWGDCHGDAGHYMNDGVLTIHGNAEEVGEEIGGGKIIVKGYMGASSIAASMLAALLPGKKTVGKDMMGGEIDLEYLEEGMIDDKAEEGRIFVQGKLVFDNGKWVEGEE